MISLGEKKNNLEFYRTSYVCIQAPLEGKKTPGHREIFLAPNPNRLEVVYVCEAVETVNNTISSNVPSQSNQSRVYLSPSYAGMSYTKSNQQPSPLSNLAHVHFDISRDCCNSLWCCGLNQFG